MSHIDFIISNTKQSTKGKLGGGGRGDGILSQGLNLFYF